MHDPPDARERLRGTEVVDSVSRALFEKHQPSHGTVQPEPPREERLVTLGRETEAAWI